MISRGKWIYIIVLLSAFLSSGLSFAQQVKPAAPANKSSGSSKEPKNTTINFEDQLVEGQVQKPELFYLLQQRKFNYKRLIRLREDFLPEMRKTSEEISHKGSGH